MSGRLTTHVLDMVTGKPAHGMRLRLWRRYENGMRTLLAETVTNADGRLDAPLLEGDAFLKGRYALEFEVGAYFQASGSAGTDAADTPFLDVVPVQFGIGSGATHVHVPLLVAPGGYSTYRGS
jgi:5-hydroxyisourate hydrolase